MDALVERVNAAIASKDVKVLQQIFLDGEWSSSIGPGEQRSLAAHLCVEVMSKSDFLAWSLEDSAAASVMEGVKSGGFGAWSSRRSCRGSG